MNSISHKHTTRLLSYMLLVTILVAIVGLAGVLAIQGKIPFLNTSHASAASETTSASGIYTLSPTVLQKRSPDGQTELWSKDLNDIGGQLAFANNRVYISTTTLDRQTTSITAFSATGQEQWTQNIETPDVFSLLATKTTLYANGVDGKVYALNTQTGQRTWTYTAPVSTVTMMTPPHKMVLSGNTLYGTVMNTFFALNSNTGQERWHRSLQDGIILGAPVVHDDFVIATGYNFFTKSNNVAYSFRLDGTPGWTSSLNESGLRHVAALKGKIFVIGRDNIYVMDGRTGAPAQTINLGNLQQNKAPVVSGETLFVIRENVPTQPENPGSSTFAAIGIVDGNAQPLWNSATMTGLGATLTVVQGTIYVTTGANLEGQPPAGYLYALTPGGSIQWQITDVSMGFPGAIEVIP